MRSTCALLLTPLLLASAVAIGVENPLAREVLAARALVNGPSAARLAARATTASNSTSSSSSLSISDLITLITPSCNATCDLFMTDLSSCAALSSGAAIASCACSSQTLGDVRSCASCVASDNSTVAAKKAEAVDDYNSFVNLCISEGLAQVTGTVSVGAETTALARTILSASSKASGATTSAPPKNATYDISGTTLTATDVAALTVPGLSASTSPLAATTAKGTSSSVAPASTSKPGSASGQLPLSLIWTLSCAGGAAYQLWW